MFWLQLSSIKKADRIAVVIDGKVKEIGTYDELMANPKGHFHRLQALQFGEEDITKKDKKKKRKKTKGKAIESEVGEIDEIDKEKEQSNARRARLLAQQDGLYFLVSSSWAI